MRSRAVTWFTTLPRRIRRWRTRANWWRETASIAMRTANRIAQERDEVRAEAYLAEKENRLAREALAAEGYESRAPLDVAVRQAIRDERRLRMQAEAATARLSDVIQGRRN